MPVFKLNDVFAGRYILCGLLGEGGFSEVWKAQDQMADDAVVAIKIYAPEKGLDDYGLRQFRKEFSLTHHLSHPHLLKVYHFDITDGSPYLIMPYCPCGSLGRALSEDGTFSERQLALIMCQVGSALKELHSQDPPIVHQDIKPDNILMMHPECFLLADFGISNQIRHTLRKSTSNMRSLTIAYAPPERFDRHPVSDECSDIFSFGVTLYEMCTNTIPWDGSGGQSLLKGGHIPALPENFSPELNKILQACMSVDRSKRPEAAALHLLGRHYLETGSWKGEEQEKVKGSDRKQSLSKILIAAALILLLTVAGFWMFTRDNAVPAEQDGPKTASSMMQQSELTERLEKELSQLKNKTAQLEEINQRLIRDDSVNKAMLMQYQNQLKKQQIRAASPKDTRTNNSANSNFTKQELEEYLNQLSNVKVKKEARMAWKDKTMEQFADGSSRVLLETNGSTVQYSASIFLNFLINVPHQVIVREVKRDHHHKIIELRLAATQSSL